jgi:transcriptional regulator with XRE-family HTH domain
MNKILQTIRDKRELKGLSQETVARRLYMTKTAYGKIERGQTELTVKRLIEICDILGLNHVDLLTRFPKTNNKEQNMSDHPLMNIPIDIELELSQRINGMFYRIVNSLVSERHRQIMLAYPYTEFTDEDCWNSFGDAAEERFGMTKEEYLKLSSGGYTELYKPEDEYEGFKKLVANIDIFYFFRLGLVRDEDLNKQFTKYIQIEDTHHLPMKLEIPTILVRNYLLRDEMLEVYYPALGTAKNKLSDYFTPKQVKELCIMTE